MHFCLFIPNSVYSLEYPYWVLSRLLPHTTARADTRAASMGDFSHPAGINGVRMFFENKKKTDCVSSAIGTVLDVQEA